MKDLTCSFCGKKRAKTGQLIAGIDQSAFICSSCVLICDGIFKDHSVDSVTTPSSTPPPSEILKYLNHYVIGQAHAKKVLSVSVYNHIYRNAHLSEFKDVEFPKSNILLAGSTGCGKTLLAKTLASFLNIPFAIADATTLTEAGYVGEDVENVVKKLLRQCDFDVEKASQGIIYIDEIDKISRKGEGTSITRDVSGEGVQQALLKLVEGVQLSVPIEGDGRKHPKGRTVDIDTSRILFIFSGAFVGLENIVATRLNSQQKIGFTQGVQKNTMSAQTNKQQEKKLQQLEPRDLVKFGMIPEFVGRMPVIATLESLDQAALVKILTQPKNSIIKQMQTLFQLHGVVLEFTPDALEFIAKKAIGRETGARGLKSIIESVLLDVMFDLPSQTDLAKVLVDKASIESNQPKLIFSLPNQVKKVGHL